jgi:hypothetical protein
MFRIQFFREVSDLETEFTLSFYLGWMSLRFIRVAEPEPKLLAGAGARISKFRLRLPAPALGQLKHFEKI